MPIRFRCAYCNQLMGIGRRKAGTVVRCPKCAGEVIVPAEQPSPAANGHGPAHIHPLFEAEDFGREFSNLGAAAPNPLMPPPPYDHMPLVDAASPAAMHAAEALLPQPAPNLSRRGLFLTAPMLFGAGFVLLLLPAIVFVLGFFLGRATLN